MSAGATLKLRRRSRACGEKSILSSFLCYLLEMAGVLRSHFLVIERVERLTRLLNGDVIMVTDSDGVDGTAGETHLGAIF